MDIASWRSRIRPLDLDPAAALLDPGVLDDLIGDARIVGLGESTHGVHEFALIKNRLIQHLLERRGFRAVALECSYSAGTAIDAWIRHGTGDRASVLSNQHYLAWDCEEFAALLDWLRAHNADLPPEQRVAFFGLDSGFNDRARDAVVEFLRRYAPERASAIEPVFAVLAAVEPQWPFRIDDDATAAIVATRRPLEELIDYLEDDPDGLAAVAPAETRAEVARFVRVIRQSADWPDNTRSMRMGENLIDLVEHAGLDGRFVVSAHNTHLGVGIPDGQRHLGDVARERVADAYRPIAFEFGEGAFLTRALDDDMYAGALVASTMPAPATGSWPEQLSTLNSGAYAMDLRGLESQERPVHGGMWIASDDPGALYEPADLAGNFDAVVFVPAITPTQPTENARWAADQRMWF